MKNVNIPTGRGIILTGNRKLAGEYVQIGKKRLHDLKQMMKFAGLKMGQKVYAFADCITMRVLSIDGNDFIRIHACPAGGGCFFETVETCSSKCSEFQILCEREGFFVPDLNRLGFISRTPNPGSGGDWDSYEWDFGDGDTDTGNFVTHFYEQNGKFTVTLTTTKIISGGGGSGIITNIGSDFKTGGGAFLGLSQAIARNIFDGNAFVNFPLNNAPAHYRIGASTFLDQPRWSISARKANYTIDLTAVPLDVASLTLRMVGAITGTPGTTFKSSLGGIATGDPVAILDEDVKVLAGTSFDVQYNDNGDYAPFAVIGPAPPTEQWQWVANNISLIQVNGPSTSIVHRTTKEIKVNSGFPGKTKQIGESITEIIS